MSVGRNSCSRTGIGNVYYQGITRLGSFLLCLMYFVVVFARRNWTSASTLGRWIQALGEQSGLGLRLKVLHAPLISFSFAGDDAWAVEAALDVARTSSPSYKAISGAKLLGLL